MMDIGWADLNVVSGSWASEQLGAGADREWGGRLCRVQWLKWGGETQLDDHAMRSVLVIGTGQARMIRGPPAREVSRGVRRSLPAAPSVSPLPSLCG